MVNTIIDDEATSHIHRSTSPFPEPNASGLWTLAINDTTINDTTIETNALTHTLLDIKGQVPERTSLLLLATGSLGMAAAAQRR